MNANFKTPNRFSATGVATAAMLIVMLAMAVSTLFPPEVSNGAAAGSDSLVAHVRHAAVNKAS